MPTLAELVPGQKYIVYPKNASDPNKKHIEGTFVETSEFVPTITRVKFSNVTVYHPTGEITHANIVHLYHNPIDPQFTFVDAPLEGGRRQRRKRTTRRQQQRRHRSRRH